MKSRIRDLNTSRKLGLKTGDYLLVTLHRPTLVDGPLLAEVLAMLEAIARELPVVFPAHPRTRKMIAGIGGNPLIEMLDPVGYLDFLSLQADAAGVLTDSGGVQEETTYLGVPCFTLRDNTERPVTIRAGTNTLLGLNPQRIADIPRLLTASNGAAREVPPGWDGNAADRVADVLQTAHGLW
jgi:UDP-N-acetylglucosamine 2-epimerase (non-hydrolysing)